MNPTVLDIVGVRKSFGEFAALDGVTFDVAAGELFGLLGPNGAGKTTLLSIIAGLTAPTSGTVALFDEPFFVSSRNRRRLVGIATQDLAVYPELTARENLVFFGQLYGMRGHDLATRTDELLAAVGLTDRAGHRVSTFSGGMKRRLNLAVAVVHRPRLLLLDEPTTGVDPQSRNHIFELVRSLNAQGMTIIYTSHYLEEVQALCPRIAILDAGKIQACDTLINLLQRLDAGASIALPTVSTSLLEQVRQLPGVKTAMAADAGLSISAADIAPVLPGVLKLCAGVGVEPTAIELDLPTLERVFLMLTGRKLRD